MKVLREGKYYKGIGDCGMTKDKPVEGTLSKEDGMYILTDENDRIYSVNPNTLESAEKK